MSKVDRKSDVRKGGFSLGEMPGNSQNLPNLRLPRWMDLADDGAAHEALLSVF
jgi:hypothetical protein